MEFTERPLAPEPYSLLPTVPSFTLTSTAFEQGDPLPDELSARGGNYSPELSWSGFPPETKSFMLNCFDPDAPTPAGFWHWTVIDIPIDVTSLNRDDGASDDYLPEGASHVAGDSGDFVYYGPNPPKGDRPHRYIFAVHALDVPSLELDPDVTPTAVAFNALFHTIARATITGTYQQ